MYWYYKVVLIETDKVLKRGPFIRFIVVILLTGFSGLSFASGGGNGYLQLGFLFFLTVLIGLLVVALLIATIWERAKNKKLHKPNGK